jgi:hypothetical protein
VVKVVEEIVAMESVLIEHTASGVLGRVTVEVDQQNSGNLLDF